LLTMVDVRDDGHVPDVVLVVHARAELVDGHLNHLAGRGRPQKDGAKNEERREWILPCKSM
jgi:hypothetical protein